MGVCECGWVFACISSHGVGRVRNFDLYGRCGGGGGAGEFPKRENSFGSKVIV